MRRINDTLYDILDSNTGEVFTYSKVTTWHNGAAMTDDKADGIIYRKLGAEYFKRNFSGAANVKWFGAKGNGATNDTVAIQKGIDFCFGRHQELYFPNGDYIVTDTLHIYNGTQLKGQTGYQYPAGFSREPKATSIYFSPTSLKSLFSYSYNPGTSGKPDPGFLFHTSISGFYLKGNSTPVNAMYSRYGLELTGVIYGSFENMGIEGFQSAIKASDTINNRFSNLYLNGTVAAVSYSGVPTTDVWFQCSFWGSPVGIQTADSPIGIRFTQCLFEGISSYGADLTKETQNMTFENCYSEDVPDNNNVNAAMFRVGFIGGGVASEMSITVMGGKYAGRNAGNAGSFLHTDYITGAIIIGANVSRYTTIIKSTANTPVNSIVVFGIAGVTWNAFTNDIGKVSGSYPNGVLNSGSYNHDARFGRINIATNATIETLITSYINPPSSWFAPVSDNDKYLGLSNLRWSTIYAGTGAINTSDANEKQQIEAISEAEHNTALIIKAGMRKFKFNDAVATKGAAARIHFGAIAQDVKAAFEAQGLDPYKYGVFCQDTWTEKDGKAVENPTGEEGEIARTRLGIRYEELLSFIISAI